MNDKNYTIGTKVIMKKHHPCGNNDWTFLRTRENIKIQCTKCNISIMIPRIEFNKKLKKIVNEE